MNTDAKKLLNDARKALKDEPDAHWPAAVVDLAEMLDDREKQLAALHKQLGAMAMARAPRRTPAG